MNAVNLCKKCGDCGECGENKYFNAFHRISYKNSPHRISWQINVRNAVKEVNAVKKIIHHISPHFLQKFTAKFTAFLTKIHCISFPTFTQSDLNSQEIFEK